MMLKGIKVAASGLCRNVLGRRFAECLPRAAGIMRQRLAALPRPGVSARLVPTSRDRQGAG